MWRMDTCTVLSMYMHALQSVGQQEVSKADYFQVYMVFHVRCLYVVDHSRVILKVPDETGCDYINASYINVSGSQCILRSSLHLSSHGVYLIAHQISFHVLLLFSLQGYMQESAYIASQGMYTHARLGSCIQTCPLMYIISIHSNDSYAQPRKRNHTQLSCTQHILGSI